jgi:chemotaxis-related protein WspB
MLFLTFELGKDRYAIEAQRVVKVLPYLPIKRVPDAPKGFAGLVNYHGRPVPVVDLSMLALGVPARDELSTRIILVRCPVTDHRQPKPEASPRLLGLIAESATELLRKEPRDFVDSGIPASPGSSYGPIALDSKGPIQIIHEDRLLTEPIRTFL